MNWDSKHDELLRQLRHDGFSFGLILQKFAALGHRLSRNSLIGRANRLRIMVPRQPEHALPKYNRSNRINGHKPIISGTALAERLRRVRPAAAHAPQPSIANRDVVAGEFLGRTLGELDLDQCRYPHGTESFTFCAQPTAPGESYCPHHQTVCFVRGKS